MRVNKPVDQASENRTRLEPEGEAVQIKRVKEQSSTKEWGEVKALEQNRVRCPMLPRGVGPPTNLT